MVAVTRRRVAEMPAHENHTSPLGRFTFWPHVLLSASALRRQAWPLSPVTVIHQSGPLQISKATVTVGDCLSI